MASLEYVKGKRDFRTIEPGKENQGLNEMITLSLDTIPQQQSAYEAYKSIKTHVPVDQTFNSRQNQAKFCLPVTINSARTLEKELEKVHKEELETKKS